MRALDDLIASAAAANTRSVADEIRARIAKIDAMDLDERSFLGKPGDVEKLQDVRRLRSLRFRYAVLLTRLVNADAVAEVSSLMENADLNRGVL